MSAPAEAVLLKRTTLYPLHRESRTGFSVDIRGRHARARVVETPFSKRKKEVSA
jgi:hypothetical protein